MLAEDELTAGAGVEKGLPAEAQWLELFKPGYGAATTMLTLGTVLFAFNSFFVSTSMPSAVREFGEAWLLSWSFTLYLVFAIVGGAFDANLKGRFGGRLTLIGATTVFAIGTLLACLADASWQVAAGRLLQGAGEGVTIAICYALIPELYPSRLVPKVFGMEAVAWAVAAFSGPVVAGLLTDYFSWRVAFAASLPPAVIFVGLVLATESGSALGRLARQVPLLRLVMLGAGILLISISGTRQDALMIVVLLAAAAVLLLLMVTSDRRSAETILPSFAFSPSRLPGPGLWIILLMPLAGSAGAVFMVYGLQTIWGLGPAEAGISNAVLAIAWSLIAIGVASLKSQKLRLRLLPVGTALLATGLAAVIVAIARDWFLLVYPAQFAIGAGFGACWGTVSQQMIDTAPAEERDKTSVLLPTLQSAGYAIGGAIFGLVANVAGLTEGLPGDQIRGVLLPVFYVAVAIAGVSIVFGYRAMRLSMRTLR